MIYWSIYLVVWVVMCPLGNPVLPHEITIESEQWYKGDEPTAEDRNLIECPEHHLALFARPKEWKFLRSDSGVSFKYN